MKASRSPVSRPRSFSPERRTKSPLASVFAGMSSSEEENSQARQGNGLRFGDWRRRVGGGVQRIERPTVPIPDEDVAVRRVIGGAGPRLEVKLERRARGHW